MEMENEAKSGTRRVLHTQCGCKYVELSDSTCVVLTSCSPITKPIGEVISYGIDEILSTIRELEEEGKISPGFVGWIEEIEAPKEPPKAPGKVVRFECGCRVEEMEDGRGKILYSCPKMVRMGAEVGMESNSQLQILVAGMKLLGGTVAWEEEWIEEWPTEIDFEIPS